MYRLIHSNANLKKCLCIQCPRLNYLLFLFNSLNNIFHEHFKWTQKICFVRISMNNKEQSTQYNIYAENRIIRNTLIFQRINLNTTADPNRIIFYYYFYPPRPNCTDYIIIHVSLFCVCRRILFCLIIFYVLYST